MKINFKTLKNEKFTIDLDESDSVENVKQKLEDSSPYFYKKENIKLIYCGKILKDYNTLKESNVQENNFIIIMCSNSNISQEDREFEISIQINAGYPIKITVKVSNSVKELKLIVQQIEGTPIENQRIFCDGVLLEDDKKLSDYKIGKDMILHLDKIEFSK